MLSFPCFKPTCIQRWFSQNEHSKRWNSWNYKFCGKLSFIQFLFLECLHCYYITILIYAIIIITFKLVPWMLNFNISYWNSIKFTYFGNTIKRKDRGWKEAFFFLFLDRFHYCYIYFHYSHLYYYYNYSQTLWIKCWVSTCHTKI